MPCIKNVPIFALSVMCGQISKFKQNQNIKIYAYQSTECICVQHLLKHFRYFIKCNHNTFIHIIVANQFFIVQSVPSALFLFKIVIALRHICVNKS